MIKDEDLEYDRDLLICYNCKSYNKIMGTEVGHCKFNAPLVFPLGFYKDETDLSLYLGRWPIVHASEPICGQFNNDYVVEIKSSSFIDKLLEYFRG